jgi:hypothetical protein
MKRRYFVLIAVLILASSVTGQERYLKPVDKASESKSFLEFRTKVIDAAERRDAKFIFSILDPQIKLSFGGDGGVADFKSMWELERKDSRFWGEFLKVMKNGGDLGNGKNRLNSFTAPYTHSSWPEDIDAMENSAILGNKVNLRETPSMDGKVIGQLSYNIVKVSDSILKEGEVADWVKVESLGGKLGWVKGEYVRSPIDFRAGFEKKRGVWKMTFFIAGD